MGCIEELSAGVFEVVMTSQKESEGEMSLKGIWVGDDGAPIEGNSFIDMIEIVGNIAGVE